MLDGYFKTEKMHGLLYSMEARIIIRLSQDKCAPKYCLVGMLVPRDRSPFQGMYVCAPNESRGYFVDHKRSICIKNYT